MDIGRILEPVYFFSIFQQLIDGTEGIVYLMGKQKSGMAASGYTAFLDFGPVPYFLKRNMEKKKDSGELKNQNETL